MLKAGVRRDQETLEVKLTRDVMPGFDTDNDRAKAEMQEFITRQIPDLTVDIQMTLAGGSSLSA